MLPSRQICCISHADQPILFSHRGWRKGYIWIRQGWLLPHKHHYNNRFACRWHSHTADDATGHTKCCTHFCPFGDSVLDQAFDSLHEARQGYGSGVDCCGIPLEGGSLPQGPCATHQLLQALLIYGLMDEQALTASAVLPSADVCTPQSNRASLQTCR